MNALAISSDRKTNKIFLVDRCTWKGHHEVYFKNILLALLDNNYIVYAACQDNPALSQWISDRGITNCHVLEASLSTSDKLIFKILAAIDSVLQKLPLEILFRYSSISTLLFIKKYLQQIGAEVPVFFAHSDSAIPYAPAWFARWFLPKSWIAFTIQPSYQSDISLGKYRNRQYFIAEKLYDLPSCKAVISLHSIYQKFFEKRFARDKFLVFPELVDVRTGEDSILVNKIQDLADGRKIISIVGSLLPKRNLKLFLESAQKLDPCEYFILVVGNFPKEYYSAPEITAIEALVSTFSPENAWIDLECYIPTEAEFNRLLEISDVIYVQYKEHNCSSNILSKAMKLRKPIIVNGGYLMAKVVKTYNWQAVVAEESEPVAAEIAKLAQNFTIDEPKYQLFLQEYSGEKNTATIRRALELL
jgi:glycosyltransferase involved in cell wall biosynthesis